MEHCNIDICDPIQYCNISYVEVFNSFEKWKYFWCCLACCARSNEANTNFVSQIMTPET